MKLRSIMILGLLCLAAMLSAQATNLFISEYVEGSSYNKALEIFNGTGAPVDLSTVSLKKQTNGAGSFGNELVLSGTLANNDVYVIVNSTSGGTNLVGQPYVDLATTSQAVNFNGNDAVALFRNGVMIDVVGIVDQVENWGADMTLVRNSNVASPTTVFSFDDWTQYPQNTFDYLGFHVFTGGSTDPMIMVNYPNSAVTLYLEQTYTIAWSSANITGNVKIELLNNTDYTTLAASVENTGSWDWTIPADHATGNQFKIKVSTLDNETSDESDAFFSIQQLPISDLSTVAQLRAATADGTTVYRLTGEAVLTYQQTYRHKKWFQDATGGIEIDDPNAVVSAQYQIGDAVSNLIGTLNTYNNLLQFTPYVNFPDATSSGNAIVPPMVTISELNSNFEPYESRLVLIENVSFAEAGGTFATNTNYTLSDGTGQIVFRTTFFEADYIGQTIPSGTMNILAITTQYQSTYQVTSRFSADFNPVSIQDPENAVVPVQLLGSYPNPFRQTTRIAYSVKSAQPVEIEIYNTKGQLVRILNSAFSQAGSNSLVWDAKDAFGTPVSSGVYMFKVKGGRFTSSKKTVLLK